VNAALAVDDLAGVLAALAEGKAMEIGATRTGSRVAP
jgi:hypothetical protein